MAIFILYSQLIFRNECNFPKFFVYLIVTQSVVMMYLFGKFYYGAYIKPKGIVSNSVHKKSA